MAIAPSLVAVAVRTKRSLEGYFARANYNFDNKYYVTASIRADGSSKFRYNDDRWGVFWSVGGAWRLSSEPWLADATWLTDLKLRADYGVIGNQNGIGRYAGYLTWSYGSTGNSTPGSFKPDGWKISQGSAAAALTWEKKKTVDVGLDFRLWDRFYGTLELPWAITSRRNGWTKSVSAVSAYTPRWITCG